MSDFLVLSRHPNIMWSGLCVWWAPNRGYVMDINRAGRYSESEARKIEADTGGDSKAVPERVARGLSMAVVDVVDLRRAISEQQVAGGTP